VAEEDLKRLIESSAAETRRQLETLDRKFDTLDTKIDDTRHHFEIIAENLDNKIQVIVEVLNGKIDSLRGDMNRGFTDVDRQFVETQAMIKFSHSELDKRIRTLESTAADHEARLERLKLSPLFRGGALDQPFQVLFGHA